MKSGNQFSPDTYSAAGETLAEIIEERGITQDELANRLGMTEKAVDGIIEGVSPLTPDIALGLELVLGVSAGFWNCLEANYRAAVNPKRTLADVFAGRTGGVHGGGKAWSECKGKL